MKPFSFYGAYETADILIKLLQVGDEESCNEEVDYFIGNLDEQQLLSLAKFTKTTLLHRFILFCLHRNFGEKRRYINKNNPTPIEFVYEINFLLNHYQMNYKPLKLSNMNTECDEIESKKVLSWLNKNEDSLEQLWLKITDEAFHILFRDRMVLRHFNFHVANSIRDWNDFLTKYRTKQGALKRIPIPAWLKKAIFHRDQGRCVFCNRDLTGLYNTLSQINFDHIVPLSCHGVNDPTNIQLSCKECNGLKSNKDKSTSNIYAQWW